MGVGRHASIWDLGGKKRALLIELAIAIQRAMSAASGPVNRLLACLADIPRLWGSLERGANGTPTTRVGVVGDFGFELSIAGPFVAAE